MPEPDPPSEPASPAQGGGRKHVRVRKRVRVRVEAPPPTVGDRARRLWRKGWEHRREILIWAGFAVVAVALMVYVLVRMQNATPPGPE